MPALPELLPAQPAGGSRGRQSSAFRSQASRTDASPLLRGARECHLHPGRVGWALGKRLGQQGGPTRGLDGWGVGGSEPGYKVTKRVWEGLGGLPLPVVGARVEAAPFPAVSLGVAVDLSPHSGSWWPPGGVLMGCVPLGENLEGMAAPTAPGPCPPSGSGSEAWSGGHGGF